MNEGRGSDPPALFVGLVMRSRFAICGFGLLLGACAAPKPVVVPVAVPQPAVIAAPVVPAAPAHCEQARDGNKIARIQTEVNAFHERLNAEPNFAWAKYEHVPCYRLVLAFTDGGPPAWLLAGASAELRRLLRFETPRLPLSHAQFDAARQEIAAAMAPTGVKAVMFVSPSDQLIRIGVITEADAALVRSVLPIRHRAITRVIPGGYSEPIPERG